MSRRRRISSACGSRRSTRSATPNRPWWSPARWRSPRRCPTRPLRPAGFTLDSDAEVDLDEVADRLVEAGYERTDQVEERGQFAVRGGILDVFGATEDRAARLELFGDEIESIRWFSTFTQRSLGEADRVELSPAAELASEHRELAELALEDDAERPDLGELLPLESFRAPLELIPSETAVIITAAEEIQTALRDHWDDVTTAIHDADARRLYVDVAAPLAERASLEIHGVSPRRRTASPFGPRRRPPRPAASARRSLSSSGSFAPALASWSRSRIAARPSGPATTSTGSTSGSWMTRPERPARCGRGAEQASGTVIRRGEALGRLRLDRPEPGRDPLPPARAPAPGGGARSRARPPGDLHRPAGRRLRSPRGPRHRPLRRLRDEDGRRRHPRLPGA